MAQDEEQKGTKTVDRRSAKGGSKQKAEPETDSRGRDALAAAGIDKRADGTLRRMGPGSRSFASFFSDETRMRPVVRGELLGLLEMLAYAERENRWYKKLWRRLNRTPGPDDIWARMALVFETRVIKPAIAAVQADLEREGREIRELIDAERKIVKPGTVTPADMVDVTAEVRRPQ